MQSAVTKGLERRFWKWHLVLPKKSIVALSLLLSNLHAHNNPDKVWKISDLNNTTYLYDLYALYGKVTYSIL